ncbi:MAG: hypothetical protein IJ577_05130, partial [Prevotella sp.]|nr:hypothetical protein [Prevotella sp.]
SRQFLKQAEFVYVDTLLKEEAQSSLTPDPSPTGEGSENQNQGENTGGSTNTGGGSAGFETGGE